MRDVNHTQSGVFVVQSDELADALATRAEADGIEVARLDCRDVRTKLEFLSAAARAFRFPDHFGHNWDAFEDCLQDLVWTAATGCVIVIDNCDPFAAAEPREWGIGLDILQRTVAASRQDGKTRLVLLRGPRSIARDVPELRPGPPVERPPR